MNKLTAFLSFLVFITLSHFGCQQGRNSKPTITETEEIHYRDTLAAPPPPPSIAEMEATEAQADSSDLEGVLMTVDTPPKYKEGFPAYLKFVREHLEPPHFPRMIYGTVWVRAVVEIDGKLTHLRVKRGIGGGWNELAIRLLAKTSGRWQCGVHQGHAVRAVMVVPVKCEFD
jgi:periplasmic protein TonB